MKYTKYIEANVNDEELLEALKNGDEYVFKAIYSHYREEFLLWLNKRFDVPEESGLDIFQEAIAGLYTNAVRGKLDDSDVRVKTLLFAIGKKLIFNYLNTDYKQDLMGEIDDDLAINPDFWVKPFEKEEEAQEVRERLNMLQSPCRKILKAYYMEGKVLSTIAEDLGYKNKKVLKSLKYRCIEKLRNSLKF